MAQQITAEPMIVAHRGASTDAPENTLAAFNLAWKQGADAIEADFRLSLDGRLVCIHDSSTSKVASDICNVEETDWATLRNIDVGSWKDRQFASERMPTLGEVLATVPTDKIAVIELKEDPKLAEAFLAELAETDFPSDQLLVISFEPAIIKGIETHRPEVKTSLLISFRVTQNSVTPNLKSVIRLANQVQADAVSLSAKGPLTPGNIQMLKEAGLDVHVWTVDQPTLAKYLATAGVDSITTNTPAILKSALDEHKKAPGK